MKLENYGVQEMDAREMNEVAGGNPLVGMLFGGIAAGLIISAMDNWGDILDGVSDAMHHKPKRYKH